MGKSIGILMQCIRNALGSILDLKEIKDNPFEMHENPDGIDWESARFPMGIDKVILGKRGFIHRMYREFNTESIWKALEHVRTHNNSMGIPLVKHIYKRNTLESMWHPL